jgi:hypothetical protein
MKFTMPFTIEQFLEVFKNYNLAVWPIQEQIKNIRGTC